MKLKTICPYCDYHATGHETLNEENSPTDKDISFCIGCGELSVFKNKVLVKISLKTLETLPKETRDEVNDISIAWLKRRAIDNAKEKK